MAKWTFGFLFIHSSVLLLCSSSSSPSGVVELFCRSIPRHVRLDLLFRPSPGSLGHHPSRYNPELCDFGLFNKISPLAAVMLPGGGQLVPPDQNGHGSHGNNVFCPPPWIDGWIAEIREGNPQVEMDGPRGMSVLSITCPAFQLASACHAP